MLDRRKSLEIKKRRLAVLEKKKEKYPLLELKEGFLKPSDVVDQYEGQKDLLKWGRTSTGEQNIKGQKANLERAAGKGKYLEFTDTSGKNYREYIPVLVSMVKALGLEGILVESFDRLARPMEYDPIRRRDLIYTQEFLRELHELLEGVRVYSLIAPNTRFEEVRKERTKRTVRKRKTGTILKEKIITRVKELLEEEKYSTRILAKKLTEEGMKVSHNYIATVLRARKV